jgi:hypothetical protein
MEAPRCLVCGTKHWSRQPCPAMGKDEKLRHARDVLRQAEASPSIRVEGNRQILASASFRGGSGCTTYACAHARARISTGYMICCVRWAPPSSTRLRRAHGHRAITRCCSKTLMAFAWKRTLFRALACLPLV